MSETGTGANNIPVLGIRAWALRSADAPDRRPFAPSQPRVDQGLTFARLLGRLGKTASAWNLMAADTSPTAERVGSGQAPPFASLLEMVSRQTGVDRALLAAVVEVESAYNPRAVSKAGAKGLMQLMNSTALSLGVADVFDPYQNLFGGARFLRGLLDRYGGSLPLALAAYNAGPGAVDRFGGVPPFAETQAYVPRVLAALQRYRQMPWGQDRAGG